MFFLLLGHADRISDYSHFYRPVDQTYGASHLDRDFLRVSAKLNKPSRFAHNAESLLLHSSVKFAKCSHGSTGVLRGKAVD
jgi:hypothetical protein